MRKYLSIKKQVYRSGDFSIVPLRHKDRHQIMNWRNEQIYHLRQEKPLMNDQQDVYFETIIADLFHQKNPNQILFSYLNNDLCIGYGGLVHINWIDKNAEISFLINTALEEHEFIKHWVIFLQLIKEMTFEQLGFHKIFTYAFDLRPKLYEALEVAGFYREARLDQHCLFEGKFLDVVIHSHLNERK